MDPFRPYPSTVCVLHIYRNSPLFPIMGRDRESRHRVDNWVFLMGHLRPTPRDRNCSVNSRKQNTVVYNERSQLFLRFCPETRRARTSSGSRRSPSRGNCRGRQSDPSSLPRSSPEGLTVQGTGVGGSLLLPLLVRGSRFRPLRVINPCSLTPSLPWKRVYTTKRSYQ